MKNTRSRSNTSTQLELFSDPIAAAESSFQEKRVEATNSVNVNKGAINKSHPQACGGELSQGKRKSARPLLTDRPLHLVIKCRLKKAFHPGNQSLADCIRETAAASGVRLYDLALNWSHVHLMLQFAEARQYRHFIRLLTSRLAFGIRRRFPNEKNLFRFRPFSRPVYWGRDFFQTRSYIIRNTGQAVGWVSRRSIG